MNSGENMKITNQSKAVLRLIFRVLLILMMIATLAFAYVNSMLPPEESNKQSGAVGNIISQIIPPNTSIGAFVLENLRKIAHFTEFGLLGMELAVYVFFFTENKKRWIPVSILLAFFAGFIDETIQMFTKRGPAIADVWIDFAGCLTYSLIAYLFCYSVRGAVRFFSRQINKKQESEKSQNGSN